MRNDGRMSTRSGMGRRERDGRRRWRVTDVSAMVALDLVTAALCGYGVLRPPSPETPVVMNACFVAIALVLAAAVWTGTERQRRLLIPVNVVVHVLGTSVAVTQAATGEGAVSAAVSYVLLTLYVASFLPRALLRPHTVLVVVASGVSMYVSDAITAPLPTWLPVVTAVVVSGALFSSHVEEMRRLSVTDPLTGALNWAGMAQAMAREQAETARTGTQSSVVVIDLDGFKTVNDQRGHAAGDDLLVDLVRSWRTSLRPRDTIARRGGDEFVLLMPATSEAETDRAIERLRSGSPITWSFGIARLDAGGDPEAALRLADARMYECKQGVVPGSEASMPASA